MAILILFCSLSPILGVDAVGLSHKGLTEAIVYLGDSSRGWSVAVCIADGSTCQVRKGELLTQDSN